MFINEARRNAILQAQAGNTDDQQNTLKRNIDWSSILPGGSPFISYEAQEDVPYDPNRVISDAGNVHQGTSPVAFSDLSYEDLGSVHAPRAFPRDTSSAYVGGNIHQDPTRDWREDYVANLGSTYPEGPHQMNMADVSGEVGEYGMRPGKGIIAADAVNRRDSKFNFPSILKGLLESVQAPYKSAEGPAWDSRLGKMLSIEEQDKLNARGGYYTDAARHARRQEKRVRDMIHRRDVLGKNIGDQNLKNLIAMGYGKQTVVPSRVVTAPNVHQGEGGSQMMSEMSDRGRARGAGETGQIAGAHHFAQGGRIGYQGGELVGQETDLIEGPQGGEEFQETVVEGQEQPSREQLEALAMHIFQLPLEELDEQQLVVVYQAAMQGQPMEEAIQEQDIQYAAGGGRIGFRYGGLVSLL